MGSFNDGITLKPLLKETYSDASTKKAKKLALEQLKVSSKIGQLGKPYKKSYKPRKPKISTP